jgi:eukaryotic-like serine/threonine-protein kinase
MNFEGKGFALERDLGEGRIMSTNEVVIEMFDGRNHERHFHYNEPQVVIIGRGYDCDIQLPPDEDHRDISRHHCMLAIDPPAVSVLDLGSTNGTYINGQKIGRRKTSRRQNEPTPPASSELHTGDIVRLANSVLLLCKDKTEENPTYTAQQA